VQSARSLFRSEPVLLTTLKDIPGWVILKAEGITREDSIIPLYKFVERDGVGSGGVLLKMATGNYVAVPAPPSWLYKDGKSYRIGMGKWIDRYLMMLAAQNLMPKPVATWGAMSVDKISVTTYLRAVVVDYAYLAANKVEMDRLLEVVKRIEAKLSRMYAEQAEIKGDVKLLLMRSENGLETLERQLDLLHRVYENVNALKGLPELAKEISRSLSQIPLLLKTVVTLAENGQVEAAKQVAAMAEQLAEEAAAKAETLPELVPDFVKGNPWLSAIGNRSQEAQLISAPRGGTTGG